MRTGTQIPGSAPHRVATLAANWVTDHWGYRVPFLESAATVRDACRDSRELSGAAMASISAPARRDGRNWPHRPQSRSKYAKSLPVRDMKLVDPGIAFGLFAQLRA